MRLRLARALAGGLVVASALAPFLARAGAPVEPELAVARVLRDGGGPCSGVLVGPREVLTVGHCVATRSPWRGVAADRLTVLLGVRRHDVAAVRVAERGPFDAQGEVVAVAADWAVVELTAPAASAPLPLGAQVAARRAFILDEPIVKIGWHRGEPRRDTCRIITLDGQASVVLFRCGVDAGRGRSGSALLRPTAAGWEVIAVQSAEARDAVGVVGIAVAPPAP